MNIIIMGGPGSGKGTICKKLVNDFNYKLISAGDLLREEKASDSELGKQIATLIDAGNLVPDNVITDIIYNEFKKPTKLGNFFLIDGYPRSIKQAISLSQMINVQIVLWLEVSEEIIKKRLDNYKEMSVPIKRYYNDCIVEIDGEGTPDEVYQRIIDTLFENVKEPRDVSDILDEE